MTDNRQYRFWAWTNFHFEDSDLIPMQLKDGVRYVQWQLEMCPTTGLFHQQGWMQLIQKSTKLALIKKYPLVHFEACTGGVDANERYTSKIESRMEGPWELGTKATKGARTDLKRCIEDLTAGHSVVEVIRTQPSLLVNIRAVERYKELIDKPVDRAVTCTILFGDSGNGKTYSAKRGNAAIGITVPVSSYRVTDYKHPFDGYAGEERLILDEYSGQLDLSLFKMILEGDGCTVPARYANKVARWTEVFICTNDWEWAGWYPDISASHMAAIQRRITRTIVVPNWQTQI